MVKKKPIPLKGPKTSENTASSVVEEVRVHTGLPPQVDGQLRCFCTVSVSQVLWSCTAPLLTIVRLKWWGEEGPGVVFRPLDVKRSTRTVNTTGRYPVRCGPRQFAAYLKDMKILEFAVYASETSPDPVGFATVPQFETLSNTRPINGCFPIVSVKDEKKLGELQVSIRLEPLTVSYDNGGSIPTTDVTMDLHHSQDSALPSVNRPQPHSQQPIKPQDDLFISPASQMTEEQKLPVSFRTQNAADLRQRLNYAFGEADRSCGNSLPVKANESTGGASAVYGAGNNGPAGRGTAPAAARLPTGGGLTQAHDLLSILVERGTELRQAMVLSSLNAQEQEINNSNMVLSNPASFPVAVGATYSPSPGVMVDNLLGGNQNPVDMLLGSPVSKREWQMLKMLSGASPGTSVGSDMMDMISEPGDLLHDRTLLQELFYKRSDSELSDLSDFGGDEQKSNSASLQDPGNVRPPSRSSSFSSLAAALPASEANGQTKKRKRKIKAKCSSADPEKLVRKSRRQSRSRSQERLPSKPKERSRSKERNPRMTQAIPKASRKSRSRSRSGSRSKSRSRSRKRKSSLSDSDVPSTPRSEVSRVSFDPAPSDVEDDLDLNPIEKQVDGLSVERLTLLGRVHVARVSIHDLILHGQDLNSSSSSRASSHSARPAGRPPRPLKNRKPCTYLIEYQFPVVAISRDKYSPNAMATEVMRVASKTITDSVVSFNHRSVFPLMFDGAALEKWWKSALIFKVYAREAGQKSPVLVGSCGVPLKSILKSDDLHLTRDLEIRELNRNGSFHGSIRNSSLNSSRSSSLLGTLKVSVELASDHKDFATCLARTRIAEMSSNGGNIVPVVPPSPPPPPPSPPQPLAPTAAVGHRGASGRQGSPAKPVVKYPQSFPSASAPSAGVLSSVGNDPLQRPTFQSQEQSSQYEAMTLHMLITVPEGCNLSLHGVPPLHMASRYPTLLQQQHNHHSDSGRDMMTRNTYLVCRMFWSNDSVHSAVCWGTLNPQYNFIQVAPVLVTPSLLERMRNNYMVIEVWDKKTTAENDKLIGICKLSLHQFFMSFRDSKIASALLKSEYPVIAIDNYMPIVDPFTGLHFGQLSVLLAIGSAQQVACLQKMKSGRENLGPQRPKHFLERHDISEVDPSVRMGGSEKSVEHVFEVVIQGLRGLKLLEAMIWGEADCFVQYFFPYQGQCLQQGPSVVTALPSLRSFRTATTLCIPDPTFHNVNRHKIILPVGTPVQRELFTACANSPGGSGGLPFEVWCRFYHPNVRDQVVARAMLPLAKLCAMVTMQKRGEPSMQSFSLPLTAIAAESQGAEGQAKMKDSGLLDVTVHYKTQMIEASSGTNFSAMVSGSQVSLSVAVLRAAGLKAAAEAVARGNSSMQYPSEVGVNAYVRIHLSFLGQEEERVTRTVARSFSPDFSHHLEFPLQLLWSGSHKDPGSLAQMLESGQALFELWHQVPCSSVPGVVEYECDEKMGDKCLAQSSGDVLLGTVSVALAQLLVRHTGIKGWFPVDRPANGWTQADSSETGVTASRIVGGMELDLHFVHTSDRQKVVEAARSVGWSPVDPAVEQGDWEDEDSAQQHQHQVAVSIDQVSIPLYRALLPGQTSLDPTARCYVRYKFYDRTAVVSRTSRLQKEDEILRAAVSHKRAMKFAHTAPFQWYLREEPFEVQVWVTYGSKGKEERPLQRDKLIGTAYVDLLPLLDSRRRQHRISGLKPLFKPGTASLSKTFIQLHLTHNVIQGQQLPEQEGDSDVAGSAELSEAEYDSTDSFHHLAEGAKNLVVKGRKADTVEVDPTAVFKVHLAVERALHLPCVRVSGSMEEVPPTTYISYQSADKVAPTYSEIAASSVDPVWDHNAEVVLSRELLTQASKNLVLKVWHKAEGTRNQPDKSCDRVLGFVSVDLSPLSSGLPQICGWYNIVDFNGQSRGQIKVSLTPVDLGLPENPGFGPSPVSFLSSRGGSVYQPAEPGSLGFQFPTSLPAFARLRDRLGTDGDTAHLSLPVTSAGSAFSWQPRYPRPAEVGDTSKSLLFSSLRQQLQDLDGLTQRLRLRLSCEDTPEVDTNQPVSARSADILNGTHSGLSTIHAASSLSATRDGLSDTSRQLLASQDLATASNNTQPYNISTDTSQNGADSGAFSGNNTGKSVQDAPDTQRSSRQVVSGEPHESGAPLLAGLPPSGFLQETAAASSEASFSAGSPPGDLTPRAFSSNSQSSQGFLPLSAGAGVGSESQTFMKSSHLKGQKGLSLTNMNEEEEAISPRPGVKITGTFDKKEDASLKDYNNHAADYDSNDLSEEEEDEMFGSYHHYRAMLDREEAGQCHSDREDDGNDSNVETITPRRINDVSGMLRQFAEHPSSTMPSVFSPLHTLPRGDDNVASMAETWPDRAQTRGRKQARERQRRGQREEKREEEKEEEEEEECDEDDRAGQGLNDTIRDRHSFVDNWLEETAGIEDEDQNGCGHLGSESAFSQEQPLSADQHANHGGQIAAVSKPNLLSDVELIDTLTSMMSSVPVHRKDRHRIKGDLNSQRMGRGAGKLREEDEEGAEDHGSWGDRIMQDHLLSKVELYSTITSSIHPSSSKPSRHLLSNVELASEGSGSSRRAGSISSHLSQHSSTIGLPDHEPQLKRFQEEEKSENLHSLHRTEDDLADFFSQTEVQRPQVNGAFDSSDEENLGLVMASRRTITAQAGKVQVPTVKGQDSQHNGTTTTEGDSGLESATKSSQDERESSAADSCASQRGEVGLDYPGSKGQPVRDFFLPAEQLQASMRALQLVTAAATDALNNDGQISKHLAKAQTSSSLIQRLKTSSGANKFAGNVSTKGRQLPTAEEAKRIAKIFSTKT